MSDRDLILSRVRAALGPNRGPANGTPSVESRLARLVDQGADVKARFLDAANRSGMKAVLAPKDAVRSVLSDALRSEAASRVLIDVADPSLRAMGAESCRSLGLSTETDPVERAIDADLAIIDATAGVGETGSVLLTSHDRRRCAWIVPPKAVILVRSTTLVPDLVDLWAEAPPGALGRATTLPAAMLLVSGPSKTADIEGVLVTGVHGPGTVHVLLIDEEA